MLQLFIMLMCFITSFIFMQMNHPLAMGLMLLIETFFLTCLLTGVYAKTFWFSYMLFLILFSGNMNFIYLCHISYIKRNIFYMI